MAIVSTIYSVFEKLAAAKVNLMVTEINSHNHNGTNGVKINVADLDGNITQVPGYTGNAKYA
jgi:hypothetical protein